MWKFSCRSREEEKGIKDGSKKTKSNSKKPLVFPSQNNIVVYSSSVTVVSDKVRVQ